MAAVWAEKERTWTEGKTEKKGKEVQDGGKNGRKGEEKTREPGKDRDITAGAKTGSSERRC